jgi:hypothetical protein
MSPQCSSAAALQTQDWHTCLGGGVNGRRGLPVRHHQLNLAHCRDITDAGLAQVGLLLEGGGETGPLRVAELAEGSA